MDSRDKDKLQHTVERELSAVEREHLAQQPKQIAPEGGPVTNAHGSGSEQNLPRPTR